MASPAAILQVFVNANTKVASAQLAAFDRQLSSVGKTSAATGVSMGKMTKGAAAAGAGLAAVGVVAVVAGKQLYDLGREFDQAYDTIRIRTGATGRELERLKGSFKDVAKNVPNDFEDVGKAIGDLNTRLGLTGKPLERMAENMLHLSNITGTDLEGNIKAVARSFVDWEVTIPKQTRYLNGMFRVSQESGASIAQLAEEVQKFGSPLRQLGFNFEEAVSMFASFERAGVNTQTMVPGLKLALSNLTMPTEDLAKKMGQLGIEAGKPDTALRKIFALLGDESNLSKANKITLAMQVFGKRAGADMKEAISQGRFEVDKFLKVFRDNKGDSIGKAADETYDFAENVQILTNRFKIFLEPTANSVVVFLDEFTRKLRNASKEGEGSNKKTTTLGTVLKVLQGILYGVGKVFQAVFRTMGRMIRGVADVVKHFVGMFKGSFAIVTGILTGNFRKAWNGAKKFTSNAVKTIAALVRTITAPFRSVFQGIYEIARDKMKGVAQVVAGFVNKIISVLNVIPGVNLNPLTEGMGGTGAKGAPGASRGLQRGGVLMGGKPSGDSIPAMLERGEYVLNREAVKKVGVQRLNQLNFKQASRFQRGGRVGLISGGDVAEAAKMGIGLGKRAMDLVAQGPGAFINLLPNPNLPEPVKGLGPWLIKKVSGFIKDKVGSLLASASSGVPGYTGPPPDFRQLGNNSWVDSNTLAVGYYLANKFGVGITDGWRPQNASYGAINSSHKRGTPGNPGALDFAPPSTALQAFAAKHIAGLTENDIHDWGTGLHNHIAFFQRGGLAGGMLRMATGGEVVRQAAPILTRRGFDHKAAAGILGNAWGESSWNPGATGYGGGGLFGFTASPVSLADLQAYASSKGKSWTHVPTQIKFMLSHGQPTGMAMRGALNALDTIPATTEKFMTDWERPGIPRLDDRIHGAFMASDIMRKMDLGGKDSAEEKKQDKIKKAKQEARKKARRKRIARKVARIAALGLEIPGLNDKGKTVNLAGKLGRLEEDAGKLLEQIDIYDREATADWSPAGSDYDQAELSSLIAYYTQLLENYRNQRELVVAAIKILQDRIANWEANIKAFENPTGGAAVKGGKNVFEKKWKVRGWKKAIANARSTIESLSTKRVDLEGVTGAGKPFEEVFGGFIGDTKFELKQLGATPSTTGGDSQVAELLRQQLQETQRSLAISQAQMPIFQQFMPKFHQGGVVQGPMGAERPVMAQAGEGIFTRDQMRAMGSQNITVVIEDAAIDSNRIRVEVDGVIQDKVSTVRRQGSNRRFTTSR